MKKTFRIILMLALVSILGACGNANSDTKTDLPSDNKSEVKQENASIVGKWKGVRMTENGEFDEAGTEYLKELSWEFKEDGTVQGFANDVEYGIPAPYTLEGDQLTIENTTKYTVTTLTKKKLVTEQVIGGNVQTEEYERVR